MAKKEEIKIELLEYKLQVKVRKGKPVIISSTDFNKNAYPSFDVFCNFPFLKDEFYQYLCEIKKEKTSTSYVNYLISLFNSLQFPTDKEAKQARKWFILLPYIFKSDIGLGFQVLDYWMDVLNKYISSLKNENCSKAKTYQNKKSALQAYINFLTEILNEDNRSKILQNINFKVNKQLINDINRQFTGISIPIKGANGLINIFLSRMRSEDRFPTTESSVFYPARILSKILGKEFNDIAKECINKITIFTKNGKFLLKDIEYIIIEKERTKAIKDGQAHFILNKEGDKNSFLIAKSEADLSREHVPSISTILECPDMEWKALDKLTRIIKTVCEKPKQSEASKISQEVMNKYKDCIIKMKKDLATDMNTILEKTTFTLMQRSLNSSLNKHS